MLAMSDRRRARGSPGGPAAADDRLSHANGGVATYVRHLLDAGCMAPVPDRHRIVLGTNASGAPVALPGTGANVLVSGDPRSGKSFVGGLIAERLVDRDYRLCVIDPEGDHIALGALPRALSFGSDLPLPPPDAIPELLHAKAFSVVLSLASMTHDAKVRYVERLHGALAERRARSGLPHWIMVDEAHYFFGEGTPNAKRVDDRTGNMLFVTYRPSQLASAVHAGIGAHVVLHTDVDESAYVESLLGTQHLDEPVHDAYRRTRSRRRRALRCDGTPVWQLFTPAPRVTHHVHHARKYGRATGPGQVLPLPRYADTRERLQRRRLLRYRHACAGRLAAPSSRRRGLLSLGGRRARRPGARGRTPEGRADEPRHRPRERGRGRQALSRSLRPVTSRCCRRGRRDSESRERQPDGTDAALASAGKLAVPVGCPSGTGLGLERDMMRVRDLMQLEVATLDAEDTLDVADDVMRLGRVRHFPIMSNGTLIGVLSQRDLYSAAASSLLQLHYDTSRAWLARVSVKSVMSTAIHAIGPDRPLRDAVEVMLRERIGCLPVVEDGELVGLLSETDCLRQLSHLLASEGERHGPRDVPL
jgi:CBS domain-containing protein